MGRSHNNHFVPRFYLEYFSEDGKRINLFNFARGKAIYRVGIRHQCALHNFYDFAPDLEEAFAKLEGQVASIIARVKTDSAPPASGSADWMALASFIVFQKLRTARAGHKSDAATDYLSKLMLEGKPEVAGIDLDEIEIGELYPAAIPLSVAADMIPAVADLDMHLFVNKTGWELITSDDPVVAHNQYCEGITHQGVTGFSCHGLQLFWPLSPEHLLVLSDRDVYRVGRADHGIGVTTISAESDIAQLNALQILNAHENVYYRGSGANDRIETQCVGLLKDRPRSRMVFVETESVPDSVDGGESALLHQYEPLLPWRLTVNAIRIRRGAVAVPLRVRANMYRGVAVREPSAGGRDMPPGRYRVKKTTRK